MFAIFDIERSFDERICRSEEDVRATIEGADLFPGHFTVVEFDTDEGTSRDVTADFLPDEDDELEYPAWDRAASRADRLHQERMEGVR